MRLNNGFLFDIAFISDELTSLVYVHTYDKITTILVQNIAKQNLL